MPPVRALSKQTADERTALDKVYETIRDRIVDGSLQPGEHLREEQLAVETETSRTPVREALQRLAAEGLVVVGTNRRCYVAEFDPREIDAIFEIRIRLESFAAGQAAKTITAVELDRLKAICEEIEKLGTEMTEAALSQFHRLNTDFHRVVIEAARSRQLLQILLPVLAMPLALLKHYVWHKRVDFVRDNRQHREIIEALESGNPAWASSCMESHIASTRPSLNFQPPA